METTQIIGSDLHLVEQITGRLTWPRVLLSGAASGAWFGLFVGLLLSFLTLATFGRAAELTAAEEGCDGPGVRATGRIAGAVLTGSGRP